MSPGPPTSKARPISGLGVGPPEPPILVPRNVPGLRPRGTFKGQGASSLFQSKEWLGDHWPFSRALPGGLC